MELGSGIDVAVANSYGSDLTPSLGTSMCHGYGPKKTKQKQKQKQQKKRKKKKGKGERREGEKMDGREGGRKERRRNR